MFQRFRIAFQHITQHDFMRALFSSTMSMLVSMAFALYNGVLGVAYRSAWNGAICVYYLLLAIVRAAIVVYQHRGGGLKRKKHIGAAMLGILIFLNIALIAPIALMVLGKRSYTFGLIPAIAMAAYTTYRITLSIIQYKRANREYDFLTYALRTINLIDSLVAVLTLQNTLIIANGGMDAEMKTLSAWTSAGIYLVIVGITVFSYLKIRRD